MIKIGNSDPKAFYIGSTNVKEIWKGGTKVWPYGIVTYTVDNFAFAYNIGQMLYVNQGNYATITARQRTFVDGQQTDERTVTMTPSRVSGTDRYTIGSDGKIRFDIDTYGTTEFSQSTAVFKGTYSVGGETYETGNYTLTLQGNTRAADSTREVQHERIPGTPYRDYKNWYAYIAASSYSSPSSRCPAKGGGSTLTISGTHEECTATPWTQDIDIYTTYRYTSDRTKEEYTETTQVSGTERTTWESKTDTLTPTMVAPDGGFSRSGNSVTIASEGTTPYSSGRYATFSVSNGTASDSVTIYQDINKVESTSTREVRGTKQYGTATTEYRNWAASISATSYSSSSSKCPASGGGTTLAWSGSHQDRTATPWTQSVDVYTTYVYTSTASKEEKTDSYTDRGTDYTSWTTRTDTLTPTMSAPDGGFTRNGTAVTIASEGKTIYNNGRTATFTVKNNTATQSVTIYQQYNILEVNNPETTTAFVLNAISKVTSSGATIQIAGTRTYKTAYKKWTSLAEEGGETKTEQNKNADSIQIVDAATNTWAHADTGGKLRIDANTTSETDRSVQFWAVCGDYTAKNGSATQWRSDYYTYTYSVDRFGLRSTSLEWDETASTEVLLTVYRTSTLHHDGGSTVIGTTTSPDDLTISLTGNTTHFSLFNNTRGTRGTSIAAKSGESIYVDVVGRNDGQTDLVTTINNSISDDKDTLTHKHRVAPADAVTIENKSSYNLMIRWEERATSEITIPAGETGYLLSRRNERIEFKVASGTASIIVKSSGETVGSGTVTTDWTNIGVEGGELDNWFMIITNL